jgi:hypothetical protein
MGASGEQSDHHEGRRHTGTCAHRLSLFSILDDSDGRCQGAWKVAVWYSLHVFGPTAPSASAVAGEMGGKGLLSAQPPRYV